MFYTILRSPNNFIRQVVRDILDEKGVFILEHADLLSIIKNNIFDTICHEHIRILFIKSNYRNDES